MSAVTEATLNGSTVEKINLNSTEIWTEPSSGGHPDGPLKFVFAPGVCAGDPPIPNGSYPKWGTSHCIMNDGELFHGNNNTSNVGADGTMLFNNGWHLEGAAIRVWRIFEPCPENSMLGDFTNVEDETALIIENGRLKPCNKRLYYRNQTYNNYLATWVTNYYQFTVICGPVPGDPSKDACSYYSQSTSAQNQTGTTIAALPSTATDGNATGWMNSLRWDPVNLTLSTAYTTNQPGITYYPGVYNGVGFTF